MESNQKQQYHLENTQPMPAYRPIANGKQEKSEGVPDIPVVRSNTPRPQAFGNLLPNGQPQGEAFTLPGFPSKAPSAPPLPEELSGREEGPSAETATPMPVLGEPHPLMRDNQDFVWLFEYGLEMDTNVLNSPERLDNLALLYGSAVLKGYTLMFASVEANMSHDGTHRTIATIVPTTDPAAEVWGLLYRIPRRFTEQSSNERSTLDSIHCVVVPQCLFGPMSIVVREMYRQREVPCVAYALTDQARRQIAPLPPAQAAHTLLAQRLIKLARKQRFPDTYLGIYQPPPTVNITPAPGSNYNGTPLPPEQTTEPLPMVKDHTATPPLTQDLPKTPNAIAVSTPPATSSATRGLILFALYLAIMLFTILTYAVLQGLGFASSLLTNKFTALGAPGLVIVYGLLGGCISSIVTLGRLRSLRTPGFVVITWFTRPYIGAVLALLTYLVLTSGIFALGDIAGRHGTLFLLVGAIAGACEGWIFFKRK